MSSSWRTCCRGSASCRRPSARRADARWRMQQMHRAANERRRRLKMFPVSGQVRAAGAGSAGSNVPGFCGSDAIGLSPARSCRAPGSTTRRLWVSRTPSFIDYSRPSRACLSGRHRVAERPPATEYSALPTSDLDRIGKQRVTPFIQGSTEIRLGMNCPPLRSSHFRPYVSNGKCRT